MDHSKEDDDGTTTCNSTTHNRFRPQWSDSFTDRVIPLQLEVVTRVVHLSNRFRTCVPGGTSVLFVDHDNEFTSRSEWMSVSTLGSTTYVLYMLRVLIHKSLFVMKNPSFVIPGVWHDVLIGNKNRGKKKKTKTKTSWLGVMSSTGSKDLPVTRIQDPTWLLWVLKYLSWVQRGS